MMGCPSGPVEPHTDLTHDSRRPDCILIALQELQTIGKGRCTDGTSHAVLHAASLKAKYMVSCVHVLMHTHDLPIMPCFLLAATGCHYPHRHELCCSVAY